MNVSQIGHVLVVSDRTEPAELLSRMAVDEWGADCLVSSCRGLSHAKETLAEGTPDVVLLDLALAGVQPIEAFATVYAIAPRVPVVLLADAHEEIVALRALRQGAEDYILREELQPTLLMRTLRHAVERVRNEAALREARERFATFFRQSPNAVIVTTQEGQALEANDACLELFGLSQEDLPSLDVREYYADPMLRERILALGETEGAIKEVPVQFRKKSGEIFDGLLSMTVRKAPDGRVLDYQAIIRDVTESRRAEERMRQRLHCERALAEASRVLASRSLRGFHRALGLLAEAIGAQRACYSRFRQGAGLRIDVLYQWEAGRAEEVLEHLQDLDANHFPGLVQRLQRGESLAVASLDEIPAEDFRLREILQGEGVRSFVSVPVIDESGELLGTLGFAHLEKARRWPEEDVGLLNTAARVVAEHVKRQRAETALRKSEARFRAMIENASDSITLLDAKGRVMYKSPGFGRIAGYAAEELLGVYVLEMVHPDDRPRVESVLEESARRPRVPQTVHYRFRHKDGPWLVFESIIYDARHDPAVGAFVVNTRNVTDREEAEAALRASEEKFRAVFENGAYGIIIYGLDGRILHTNQAADRKLGYSPAEFRGMNIAQLVHPADLSVENRLRCELLEGSRGHFVSEKRMHQAGGEVIWIRSGVSLARDAQGTPKFYIEIGADITREKRAEEALRESEKRYRALIENVSDAITILEGDGAVRYVSPAFERITGYAAHERVGMSAFERVHPDDLQEVRTQFLALQASPGQLVRVEARLRHKDGEWRNIELIGKNLLLDPAVHGLVVVYRDITERVQLEEQFRQAQKMDAVGRLAGGIAHDFNNLLNVIGGNVYLAMEALPAEHAVHEDLQEIRQAAERAASLTQQLLAFSRKQILKPRVVEVNDEVVKTSKMLRRVIGDNIGLTTRLGAAGTVRVDPGQLSQVLVNLALNARDAMPQGGELTIDTARVELTADQARHISPDLAPGWYAQIEVADTGTGMAEDLLPHIFEPFFTTKEVGKGTGLGLATVYGIVEQSGGHIRVESRVGSGSTFRIHLPSVEPEPASSPASPSPELPRGRGETVLLVEDAEGLRRLIRRVLQKHGYKVLDAAYGPDALEVASRHSGPIHLAVTDVVMPEMSGKELADQLVERYPGIRVLYISGYTDEDVVHHGIERGERHFLQKPISPDQLILKVQEILQ